MPNDDAPPTGSAVAADGKLYLSSEDGEILVVKTGPAFEIGQAATK